MGQLSNSLSDLIVILGPTATGKTNLAIRIAEECGCEIISADSRQVYRGMDIGTGKDLNSYVYKGKTIPYHLIDIADPSEEYNVSKFQKDFQCAFSAIRNRNKMPLLCGGTGFYIKAVLMDFKLSTVGPDKKLRQQLETWTLKNLIQKLDNISPGLSMKIPIDTKRRVIRAIEIALSRVNDKGKSTLVKNKFKTPLVLGVNYPRQIIRDKITTRLHERFENGMIEEVECLIQNGVTHERLDNLGLEYRFISSYLQGKISKNEMITQLNIAIHRFAKKQMTFFRNMEKNGIKINWILEGNIESALKIIKG